MIHGEGFQSFGQYRDLISLNERSAGADALLLAAAGVERDAGDAIVHHFFHQVGTCEARIAEGEVEAVGDRFAAVLVVCDVEAVLGEGLLHQLSLATVFEHVVAIAVGTVVDGLQHGGEGILGGVGGA